MQERSAQKCEVVGDQSLNHRETRKKHDSTRRRKNHTIYPFLRKRISEPRYFVQSSLVSFEIPVRSENVDSKVCALYR